TDTLPPPVSVISVTDSAALQFGSEISRLPELLAVKLPTAFAPPSVVPPTELVVSRPLDARLPVSVIVPAEVAVIAPEVLLTALFTSTLPAVTVVRPTVPEPPAVTAAPVVRLPEVAVSAMVPLPPAVISTLSLLDALPIYTDTLPPPVSV